MRSVTVVTGAYSPVVAKGLLRYMEMEHGYDVLVRTNNQSICDDMIGSGRKSWLIPISSDAEGLGRSIARLALGDEIVFCGPIDMGVQAFLTFISAVGRPFDWLCASQNSYECVGITDGEELRSLINALKV